MPSDNDSDIVLRRSLSNAPKKWKRIRAISSSDESTDTVKVNSEPLQMEEINMKSRKRSRNQLNYAQNIRKMKRNSGEEYETKKSKLVSGKLFEHKDCRCSKQYTCQKCDSLKLKIEASSNEDEKLHLMEIRDSHLISAEQARKSLTDDIQKAKDNPSEYYAFTFDLQKALAYPKLSVSVAYYKRNIKLVADNESE
ncbi:uncharacterized protein LOC129242214 [Anastrepha obliqua]|uniref:uncharacterized protein LOC129242214 n=1 Tax=Anastrepha obliqua TaxID=95512 RepID=UPI002409ED69|nr:uncharacterized protein LOC129242214 [Anastrepha obliqua]